MKADWQLCVLHAVRNILYKVRRTDREAFARDLKAVYQPATEEEVEEALRKLRERWGMVYPRVVACWETKAYALLAFVCYPKPMRRYLIYYKLARARKQRSEPSNEGGEEAVEKLLHLVLNNLNEQLKGVGCGALRKY